MSEKSSGSYDHDSEDLEQTNHNEFSRQANRSSDGNLSEQININVEFTSNNEQRVTQESNTCHLKAKCLQYLYCSPCKEVLSEMVDVTNETCAFIDSNDTRPKVMVETDKIVVLELIAAKLSDFKNNVVPNSQYLSSPTRLSPQHKLHNHNNTNNQLLSNGLATPKAPTSPSSITSKRYVSYTILVKRIPGLDSHPAVIERRFSDFLILYQSLKNSPTHADYLRGTISFPKKILVGNFNVVNIAERSVEFARLITLCIRTRDLTWSPAFVSFLLDKELRESHRMVICENLDEAQAAIENVYYILEKVYLKIIKCPSNSPVLLTTNNNFIVNGNLSYHDSSINNSFNSSEINVTTSNQNGTAIKEEDFLVYLFVRILSTYCILVVIYFKGGLLDELYRILNDFCELISIQIYFRRITVSHGPTVRALLLLLSSFKNPIYDKHKSTVQLCLGELGTTNANGMASVTFETRFSELLSIVNNREFLPC